MTLKASSGEFLLNPRVLSEGAENILLGNPVLFMQDMTTSTTVSGAKSIVYADWRRFYTVVDRFGIRVLRDPFTDKPHVLFYTTKRTGGAVSNFDAGKILTIAS